MSKSSKKHDYIGWFTEGTAKKPGMFSENFFHGQEPSLSIDFSDSMANNDHFLFNHEAVRNSGSIHDTLRRFHVVLLLFYLNSAAVCCKGTLIYSSSLFWTF